MNKNTVILTACADYAPETVKAAVDELFTSLGGIEKFISPGDKVLLKPNLVTKRPPEAAVTTHPVLVEEIARRVLAAGAADVVICDSPGGLYNEGFVGAIYRVSGMADAAKNSGARLNEDWSSTVVKNDTEDVRRGVYLDITNAVLNADKIINLAKLKTHGFTGYTGAAKNLFGTIAGLVKVQMHADHQSLEDFCHFLVDLNQYLKPKIALHIIDAVIGMERDGPTAGDPRFIGRLIAAENPYYADYAGARLMNVDPMVMPLCKTAAERGAADYGAIEYAGCSLEESIVRDYKAVVPENFRKPMEFGPRGFRQWLYKRITRKPKIKRRRCRACGKCVEHCPAKALSLKTKASLDLNKCIKCFCCQELCPFKAVVIKKPFLYRFATRSNRRKKK